MKVYVASSWRNKYQQEVVRVLREDGHEVYDFKGPDTWFSWDQVDPLWNDWGLEDYLQALQHPVSQGGFDRDMTALMNADACVYVMPCGISASLEAGYAKGAGKMLLVYIPDFREPELMIKMADAVTNSLDLVRGILSGSSLNRPKEEPEVAV